MNNKDIWTKIMPIFPKIKKLFSNTNNIIIEEKDGVGNYVTNLDKKIDEYIHISLNNIFPNATIISEETDNNNLDENELIFIVDPLDGTTNYINNWPYTVAIGIINNKELICGIIYDVLKEKIYSGIKNYGVFECSIDNIFEQKQLEKPEYKDNIKKSIICHDTPYGAKAFEKTLKLYNELYTENASIKAVVPISLDVLKTALGKKNRANDYEDAVWHMEVRSWDLAAATCILREFGGDVIDCKTGKSISIDTLINSTSKISFIASGSKNLRQEIYKIYKNID